MAQTLDSLSVERRTSLTENGPTLLHVPSFARRDEVDRGDVKFSGCFRSSDG